MPEDLHCCIVLVCGALRLYVATGPAVLVLVLLMKDVSAITIAVVVGDAVVVIGAVVAAIAGVAGWCILLVHLVVRSCCTITW